MKTVNKIFKKRLTKKSIIKKKMRKQNKNPNDKIFFFDKKYFEKFLYKLPKRNSR